MKAKIEVSPVDTWGRRPLYSAKVGSGSSNLVMIRRVRKFAIGQRIKFAAVGDVRGMSTGVTPKWRSGIVWDIEDNRLSIKFS